MNKTKIVQTDDAKTIRLAEACQRYGLGETSMRRIVRESGAGIKIGKILLINVEVLDKYMDDRTGNE